MRQDSPSGNPRSLPPQPTAEQIAQFERRIEEAHQPPPRFKAAVSEFAGWVGVDPDAMVRGDTFLIGGVAFTLMHHGAIDPGGATVVVDYGDIAPGSEHLVARRLLEHNFLTPAGLHGCFGLAPGVDKMLFCIRVDLAAAEDPAKAIGDVVGVAVESIRAMCLSLMNNIGDAQARDAVPAAVA